ncbi:MAG: UPF0182 family protein [Candidatus Eremiobacteraeota bacterium]|nr:UPF0182 family protein [Candidatus Eremiobacteraeota bacterium]
MSRTQRIRALAAASVVTALVLALVVLSGPYLRYLWLDSLSQTEVFWTLLWNRIGCVTLGFLVMAAVVYANLWLCERNWPSRGPNAGPVEVEVRGTRVVVVGRPALPWWVPWVLALGAGLLGGLAFYPLATTWLTFYHRVPFNTADPLFGYDVSTYVFTLPFCYAVLARLNLACVTALLVTGLFYVVRGNRILLHAGRIPPVVVRHLMILLGIFVLLRAPGFWLDRLDLAVNGNGLAAGAGYVDAHVLAPANGLMALATLVVGLFLILYRRFDRPLLQLSVLVGVSVLGLMTVYLLPAAVQAYVVRPNEIARERPFVEGGIKMTRLAYGLDRIEEVPFLPDEPLSPEILSDYSQTLDNVRLWDPEPLQNAYEQLQSLRTYYGFEDVDIDRYQVDGSTRQVMLSAREISVNSNTTWVNRHLKYTHGYGVVVSPVNERNSEGQPLFWLKNLPPSGLPEFAIERPEIYFGEATKWYVLVNTREPELSYSEKATPFQGTAGIPVRGGLRRLAMSIYLSDPNILLSGAITPNTRLLFDRDIRTRLHRLVPFLEQEPDPYLVIHQGKLHWIVDLYTVTNRYPYSHQAGGVNYVRNSVKAVIDAYSGEVQLVVVDDKDPLLKVYRSIFPKLFVDRSQVDPEIAEHFRYPERLLKLQADVFKSFHMTDPEMFYNREDLWELAQETYMDKERTVEPYYLVMRLPGEPEPEFILMLPFTPKDKDNLNAWMAARCDDEQYGRLLLYRFPKDRLVYGPKQIEARINQDEDISGQLTLWNQQGSTVIRGNLLVIPIERSLLYVEPLYLQTQGKTRIPELKRVIVATAESHGDEGDGGGGNRVVMRESLELALAAAFGIVTAPVPVVLDKGTPRDALNHIENAEGALSKGDWKTFGVEMQKAKGILSDLSQAEEAPPPPQKP